eukprot:TRINITY_DN10133_c0_g1_i1.p1 TRINITY_DN10133_c0_g1~~TRINITY_DN10133_c0_g1_i1.p1  ORF type:complete len:351 (-),score=43.99 TRINITY_DN10133_c0_g1_i1:538-1551(-)
MEPPDATARSNAMNDEIYFIHDDGDEDVIDDDFDALDVAEDANSDQQFSQPAGLVLEDASWKQTTLNEALEHQRQERNGKFSRTCPICGINPFPEAASLREMFSHMFTEHHFNMGHPDNLVFVPELLDLLDKSLLELRCIYCEKVFKTRQILKEHMRKKRHIRIHPKNPRYDRFYVLNYSKDGFLTPSVRSSASDDFGNQDINDEEEETWEDWIDEDADRQKMRCLFCEELSEGNQTCFDHMVQKHNFDLSRIRRDEKLDFYATVRLVNYIRRRTAESRCPMCCSQPFTSATDFLSHLSSCKSPIPLELVQDDTLLVPVLADDNLLTSLVDSDSEDE